MEAMEIVRGLAGFTNRGAGTDAERRAAGWLARELPGAGAESPHAALGGAEATVETFWCRPNRAITHALHAALAIAGSLVSLASPIAAIAILAVVLVSIAIDSLIGISPARRLTRERASQNVLLPVAISEPERADRVRLLLTANYDTGRTGLAYRGFLRRPASALKQMARAITPGWLGWMSIAIVWLLVVAILRLEYHSPHVLGAVQLLPTVVLLIALALLLDLGAARWSPGAGDNASGVAVAVTLAQTLAAAPPQHLDVELVLTGAGDGDQIGLRRYLRSRRGIRAAGNTVVVGIGPCAEGSPCWWFSDGPLIPLRYARALRELASEIEANEPHLSLRAHKGRGSTPGLPARWAGLPAITVGCLDRRGVAPRSHEPADTPEHVIARSAELAIQFGLLVVDAIDAAVGELDRERVTTPA